MNTFKNKLLLVLISTGFLFSCNVEYISDPDSPVQVPTSYMMNNAQYDLFYSLGDEWVAGYGVLGFAQYWALTGYTNENRYQLRVRQIDDMWEWPYKVLTNLKEIIALNDNPETKKAMQVYGDNNNQIQISRILMSYAFSKLVDTFGDVPYWSYRGKNNPKFEGLRLNPLKGDAFPSYTDAKEIYGDMLADLLEASNALDTTKKVFESGDNLYKGDVSKWIAFAHSLRLRLAVHLLKSDPTLARKIFNESNSKAFSSNGDNADFTFGSNDKTGGPWNDAFTVAARTDFAPALSFIDLLYNRKGPFSTLKNKDPRVDKYFDKGDNTSEVVGVPYGFGDDAAYDIEDEGIPSERITKPDYTQPVMQYAEIEFIRSEFNSWNQTNYEKGVKASMEYWGVTGADAYVASLPAANEETVLTQKYIALYMDGLESWTEYRRTAYPKTLSLPGDKYGEYVFETLIVDLSTIPNRVSYPKKEQLVNEENWRKATNKMPKKDTMLSKIFWDVVD